MITQFKIYEQIIDNNYEGMIFLFYDGLLYHPSIIVEKYPKSDYLVYERGSFHVKLMTYNAPVTPVEEVFKKVPKVLLKVIEDVKNADYGRKTSNYKSHQNWCDKLEKIIKEWYEKMPELEMWDEISKYNL